MSHKNAEKLFEMNGSYNLAYLAAKVLDEVKCG